MHNMSEAKLVPFMYSVFEKIFLLKIAGYANVYQL